MVSDGDDTGWMLPGTPILTDLKKDKSRQIWFYRDWVVKSLNRDLPYDQFVIEQLAGDLLPNPTQDQIVATGFLRNSMLNEEGGVDPGTVSDGRHVRSYGSRWKKCVGADDSVAQCHTHKYDPITHDEYYGLFAFLNNDHEVQRVVYSDDELVKIAGVRAEMAEVERQLKQVVTDWKQRLVAWESDIAAGQDKQAEWTTLRLVNAGDNGQRYFDMEDWVNSGPRVRTHQVFDSSAWRHRSEGNHRHPVGIVE